MTPVSNGGRESLDDLRERIGHGLRHPRYGSEVEGPRLIQGHEWEEGGALLNDWREVCRTVIEYGRTEKRCVLTIDHDGPHVWGEERPKPATIDDLFIPVPPGSDPSGH